jgi:hypothetical protein
MKKPFFTVMTAALFLAAFQPGIVAQTTVMPYERTLNIGGVPANGSYDLRFILYTTQGGAVQVGNPVERLNIDVSNGTYSVDIDFGAMPFTTQTELWVDVSYKLAGNGGGYIFTGVRDQMKASPYAIRAYYATTANYAQTADSIGGLYPANIVQNNSSGVPQPGVSVNVSGDVSGFNVNAVNAYHIGYNKMFSSDYENLYAGLRSGEQSAPDYLGNSFFGSHTGTANKYGIQNSFYGNYAGNRNTSSFNSFFGYYAGAYNTTGTSNSFFGAGAGNVNETGTDNTFIGRTSGQNNTKGVANTFVGSNAGAFNVSGSYNTFIGFSTGPKHTSQKENTVIGARADVSPDVSNATAIGNFAFVERPNSVVLGSINGVNGSKSSTNVGIGTTKPLKKLEVVDASNTGLRVQTNATGGTVASFGVNGAFQVDAAGVPGGRLNVTETGNVGIGITTPASKLHVNGSIRISGGDLIVPFPFGIIFQDSDGNCYRLRLNQSGQVVVGGVFCP